MFDASINQIEKKIRLPWQTLERITIAHKKAGNNNIQIMINKIYSRLKILSHHFPLSLQFKFNRRITRENNLDIYF